MPQKTFNIADVPTTKTKGGVLLISRPPIVVNPQSDAQVVQTKPGSRIVVANGLTQLPKIQVD